MAFQIMLAFMILAISDYAKLACMLLLPCFYDIENLYTESRKRYRCCRRGFPVRREMEAFSALSAVNGLLPVWLRVSWAP